MNTNGLWRWVRDLTLGRRIFWFALPLVTLPLLVFSTAAYETLERAALRQANDVVAGVLTNLPGRIATIYELTEQSLLGDLAALRHLIDDRGSPALLDGKLVLLDGANVHVFGEDAQIVDELSSMTGSDATIFRISSGEAVRVSTNVIDQSGARAVGTVLDDTVFDEVVTRGNRYLGLVNVVGTSYVSAYEPLKNKDGDIVGILFVGKKRDSLYGALLREIIATELGGRGHLHILDAGGDPVIDAADPGAMHAIDPDLLTRIMSTRDRATAAPVKIGDDGEMISWYRHLPRLDWTITAHIYRSDVLAYFSLARNTLLVVLLTLLALLTLASRAAGRRIASDAVEVVSAVAPLQGGNADASIKKLRALSGRLGAQSELGRINGAFLAAAEGVKNHEAQQATSERRLRNILDLATDAVHILDVQGNVSDCSRSFADQLGYEMDEAKQLNVADWDIGIAAEALPGMMAALLETPQTFETRHRRHDGSTYEAEVNARGITLDGEVFLYASARDITERKRAERELFELKERYKQFFEVNTSVKLVIDPESGAIVHANRAATEFYGYSRHTLESMNIDDINVASPDEIAAERQAAKGEKRLYFQFQHRMASGEIRDVEVYSGPVHIDDRVLLYSIIHDVTERHRQAEELEREHQRLSAIIAGTAAGTWEWNVQTGEARFSERWAGIIGHTLDELEPISIQTWLDKAHPEDLEESAARLQAHFEGHSDAYEITCRMRHKNGHWVWVHDSGRLVSRTADGEPEWVFGTHIDISSLKEHELAATRARDRLEAIAQSTNVGVIAINSQGGVEYISPRFSDNFNYTRDDLEDWDSWSRRAAMDRSSYEVLCSALKAGRGGEEKPGADIKDVEIRLRGADGRVRHNLFTLRQAEGDVVMTFTDITQQKHHEEYVFYLSQHDSLTGLPNRALLSERLEWHVRQVRRTRDMLCVAFLDLDGFKLVNDRHGHEAGDEVLKAVSRRLKDAIRETDTVARLGGDEFAIIFSVLRSRDECIPVVRRVLDAVGQPIAFGDASLHVSGSMGLAFFAQESGIDGDQLLRRADKAMYDAKLAGRNRFSVFDQEEDRNLQRQNRTLGGIAAALESGAFELHFQPKINMRSGAVIGAEALLRWPQPSGEILPPSAFLPAVYDHDLSKDLGTWVLKEAVHSLDHLLAQGRNLCMSINVFPRQFMSNEILSELRQLLQQYPRITPAMLELELVETAALSEFEPAAAVMRACRDLGVRSALDDFGTGFSSLAHLKHLPVATLKIDKTFVRDMLSDPEDFAIVQGTVSLARAFSLDLVAEGVESIEQGEVLLEMGCDVIQGYYVAKAMPLDLFNEWIDVWTAPEQWTRHQQTSGEMQPPKLELEEF